MGDEEQGLDLEEAPPEGQDGGPGSLEVQEGQQFEDAGGLTRIPGGPRLV